VSTLTSALRGVGTILADGFRVLLAHWPQLVGLFLAGWAARMAALWLVVLVSDVSPTVAIFLLPLAPMATLTSLVLMVRVTSESLPAFRDLFTGVSPRERWRSNLAATAQVLVPFLAVYASQGLLADDARAFIYDATADEWMNAPLGSYDFGRAADYASGPALLALIVVVLILRKVIMLAELGKKAVIWSFIATYLEVLWLVTLVHALTNQIEAISAWITSRRLISGFLDWWNAFLAALPHIGGRTFVEFVGGIVSSMGDLVVVPVAWLAIGAAVYGAKLAGRREFETPEQVTERLNHIPSPVRRVVAHAVEPVTSPIKDTVTAIGKVASAGTIPMVLFCLVFVIAAQVKVAVAWVFRTAVGPRDPWILYSLAPYSTMFQRLFYFVIALSLLAAAVNAVVLGQRATADAAPESQQAQVPTPSSA